VFLLLLLVLLLWLLLLLVLLLLVLLLLVLLVVSPPGALQHKQRYDYGEDGALATTTRGHDDEALLHSLLFSSPNIVRVRTHERFTANRKKTLSIHYGYIPRLGVSGARSMCSPREEASSELKRRDEALYRLRESQRTSDVAASRAELDGLRASVAARAELNEKAVARAEGEIAALRVAVSRRDAAIDALRSDLATATADHRRHGADASLRKMRQEIDDQLRLLKDALHDHHASQQQQQRDGWWPFPSLLTNSALPCSGSQSGGDDWWLPPSPRLRQHNRKAPTREDEEDTALREPPSPSSSASSSPPSPSGSLLSTRFAV